jgi:hypothetical protein
MVVEEVLRIICGEEEEEDDDDENLLDGWIFKV